MASLYDEMIFALTNASVWFSNPAFALLCAIRLRRIPDFARPRGHNELSQWRKHFDHNPLFPIFCDKLASRAWAKARVPELKTAEVVWVGTDPAAVPEEFLTDGYVAKSTVGSGRNYFPGRGKWTVETRLRRFRRWLVPSGGLGEWGYTQVRPRLFVERLLAQPSQIHELNLRCHDGRVTVAFCVHSWKAEGAAGTYLDSQGKRVGTWVNKERRLNEDEVVPKEIFDRAAAYAKQIAVGIDQLRVDFFVIDGELRLGELTVYPASGFGDEEVVGISPIIERAWLRAIDKSWFLSSPQRGLRARYAEAFRRYVPIRLAELGPA